MWIFSILNIFFVFCISFLPIFLDTGLQIWNGLNINSTDFERTGDWNLRASENEKGKVSSYSSAINFPDDEDDLAGRNDQVAILTVHSVRGN